MTVHKKNANVPCHFFTSSGGTRFKSERLTVVRSWRPIRSTDRVRSTVTDRRVRDSDLTATEPGTAYRT
eukprot:688131-Hanusia_phi.AAC.1